MSFIIIAVSFLRTLFGVFLLLSIIFPWESSIFKIETGETLIP